VGSLVRSPLRNRLQNQVVSLVLNRLFSHRRNPALSPAVNHRRSLPVSHPFSPACSLAHSRARNLPQTRLTSRVPSHLVFRHHSQAPSPRASRP
jgi:hypothetical protein